MASALESKKIALASTLTALGIVIAPFIWFPFMGSRAYPGQHLINALAGVYLGPWWAVLIATMVGTIRISLGIGTIYAYPGGVFGGLVVGFAYRVLRRLLGGRRALISALTEPIGTLLIGAPLSLLIVSPIAPIFDQPQIEVRPEGLFITLIYLWFGWGASTFSGSIAAYFVLNILFRYGFSREELLGE
jgi:energy coupling factor transporter S component ThiW